MAVYAGRYSEDLQDRYGNGFRNAKVAVQTLAGGAVTLYADRDKTAYVPAAGLAANEIKADNKGNLKFFAAPGNYQIVVTPSGGSTLVAWPVSVFPDPLELGAGIVDSSTFAGLGTPTVGKIQRVTDNIRGPWFADGVNWNAFNGEVVNVKFFGAKGDGVTDDTVACQLAANQAAGKTLVFPGAGPYLIYGLKIPANCTVELGTAMLLKRPAVGGDQDTGAFTGNESVFPGSGFAPFLYLLGDAIIRNGTLDGNRASDTLNTGSPWGGSFSNFADRAGILGSTQALAATKNVVIEGVLFKNMVGCGIDLSMTGDITVKGCREENTGHLFAFITADSVTNAVAGTLDFANNVCRGDRVNSNVLNPWILERKLSITIVGNTTDELETSLAWGCKIQEVPICVVSGNTFRNTYLKPQSSAGFLGDSFSIVGNSFSTSVPTTHRTGVSMGSHRVKAMTVASNSITNGSLSLERSTDDLNVTGNTIKCHIDSRLTGQSTFWAIEGGANQNSNISGKILVADNLVDLNGLTSHCFFNSAVTLGDTTLKDNIVIGADALMGFLLTGDRSADKMRIIGNVFKFFRSITRANPIGLAEFTLKDNLFTEVNPAAMTNINSTTNRNFYLTPNNGTFGAFIVEGNVFDMEAVSTEAMQFLLGTVAIPSLVIANNVFKAYNTTTGYSMTKTGGTVTALWVKGNLSIGDINLAGTNTAEIIENNSFTTAIRKVLNTTRKAVNLNGVIGTTVGAAGAASALPATPEGYASIMVDGTERKVPYYRV